MLFHFLLLSSEFIGGTNSDTVLISPLQTTSREWNFLSSLSKREPGKGACFSLFFHAQDTCAILLGRSTGRGNPRGSRVGVCTGMGTGCHTAHPVPRPIQTWTHALIFPWVHCDRTRKCCTVHMLHRTMLARYVFMSAFTYTHTHRQTFSFTHTDASTTDGTTTATQGYQVRPHLVVHMHSPTSSHNNNNNGPPQ